MVELLLLFLPSVYTGCQLMNMAFLVFHLFGPYSTVVRVFDSERKAKNYIKKQDRPDAYSWIGYEIR
jgi:hypothetical protein